MSNQYSNNPRSSLRYRIIDADSIQLPLHERSTQERQLKPDRRMTTPRHTTGPVLKPTAPVNEIAQHAHFKSSFIIVGVAIGLLALVLGQFIIGWVNTTLDDVHYGRPRTFQTDAFVGHETGTIPSHFTALNYKGRIEILEFPGGDVSHARVFTGPQLLTENAELVPVTLQFVDTQHNKHPDMLVSFLHSHVLFHNDQGTFQPTSS